MSIILILTRQVEESILLVRCWFLYGKKLHNALKVHSIIHKIIIFWFKTGTINIIMISACLWDVTALAKHLGLLVQLSKNESHRKNLVEPNLLRPLVDCLLI